MSDDTKYQRDTYIPAEDLLGVMRRIIEANGEAQAMVFMEHNGEGLGVPVDHHPVDTIKAITMLVEAKKLPRPKWAQVVSDSYRTMEKTEEAAQQYTQPGNSMAERFAAGDPKIVECLMVWSTNENGDSEYASQSYLRLKDSIVWSEIEKEQGDPMFTGNVPNGLRELVYG